MKPSDIKQGRFYVGKTGSIRRVSRFLIDDEQEREARVRLVRYIIIKQPATQQRRAGGVWECTLNSFAQWAVREVRE
jgi:hypothetical protein